MSSSSHGSHLAAWLRALTDDELLAVLDGRPDLAVPLPGDFATMAQRASSPPSIRNAVSRLTQFELEVLDAVRVVASLENPGASRRATTAAVHELLHPVSSTTVDAALARLRSHALIWPSGDGFRHVGSLGEVRDRYPAGLGRSLAQLGSTVSSAAILAEIAAAPTAARTMLDRLAAGPPIGTFEHRDVPAAVVWLLEHGLVTLIEPGAHTSLVELPCEVGLALRGDRPLGELHPQPPAHETQQRDPSAVDAAAIGAIAELLRHVDAVLAACAADPPTERRSGGLTLADQRRLAATAGVDAVPAAFLLELCRAAQLLGRGHEYPVEWLPTPDYDAWRAAPAGVRWHQLAAAWLAMPRLPYRAGGRGTDGNRVAPLSADTVHRGAATIRREVLQVLATLPAGTSIAPSDVAVVAQWRAPVLTSEEPDALLAIAHEAEQLGITGRWALTTFGRAMDADDTGTAINAVTSAWPSDVDYVLVQADLTVVAPGPLVRSLADELALVAEPESAGAATVYRVTTASVQRALDAGRSAADLHRLFTTHSRTPIPQTLTYLIDDAARRHGGVRVGVAGAYIRSADSTLITAMVADRNCAALQLRALAPTIAITPVTPHRLVPLLLEAGYPAAVEDNQGTLVVARVERRRAPLDPPTDVPARPTLNRAELRAALPTLRRADAALAAARSVDVTPSRDQSLDEIIAALHEALEDRRQVCVGFVDGRGVVRHRTLRVVTVGDGYLRATDERAETTHTFALHRLASARAA